MKTTFPRRAFLRAGFGAAALAIGAPRLLAQTAGSTSQQQSSQAPRPAALPLGKVEAVVTEAHRSLEAVRALVEETPLLVNACWDWGAGDFETPLQAAAHMGRRDIAEYLLGQRARLDVFAAAMLGQLEFVQAAFAIDPRVHDIPGPHGFTLLHCALRGGDAGKRVADWMRAQGVPDETHRPLAIAAQPA